MNYCLNQSKLTLKQFDKLKKLVDHEITQWFHFEGGIKRKLYLIIEHYGEPNACLNADFIPDVKKKIKDNPKLYIPLGFDAFIKRLKRYKKGVMENPQYTVNPDGTITMMGVTLTKQDIEGMLKKLLKW